MRKKWVFGISFILLVLAGAGLWLSNGEEQPSQFRLGAVTKGDLTATIGATGTLEPEELVDVGAQVAGQILSLGTDAKGAIVDYGSLVEEGTVLARLDDELFQADLVSAESKVKQAHANLMRAKADLEQARVNKARTAREWARAERLGPSEALAPMIYDKYKSDDEAAAASVTVAEAGVAQSEASVSEAETLVTRARRNLAFTVIKSPVRGVVIDRRVNVGQTVVASLNAPSLFLIAKDLRKLQVWVAVNEADIGSIKIGMPVGFTADAFPDRKFRGTVGRIRLNATLTQNVVTYIVEVNTDNADGALLPYLTANVRFETDERKDVLRVPNAALRWIPEAAMVPEDVAYPELAESESVVWVATGPSTVKPLRVKVGITDGLSTEISGEGITEGLEVVVGKEVVRSKEKAATNPFVPTMPRHNRNPSRR